MKYPFPPDRQQGKLVYAYKITSHCAISGDVTVKMPQLSRFDLSGLSISGFSKAQSTEDLQRTNGRASTGATRDHPRSTSLTTHVDPRSAQALWSVGLRKMSKSAARTCLETVKPVFRAG
jgi:hypothetical protein